MIRIRGFRIGRKGLKLFRWLSGSGKRTQPAHHHHLLDHPPALTRSPVSKILNLGRQLVVVGVKRLLQFQSRRRSKGYIRESRDPSRTPQDVPKGHLAVYVGKSDNDTYRVVVPIVYFNHPLFGELLAEAEKVYGFDHTGGIKLPCGISEFERVQNKIAATIHCLRRTGTADNGRP